MATVGPTKNRPSMISKDSEIKPRKDFGMTTYATQEKEQWNNMMSKDKRQKFEYPTGFVVMEGENNEEIYNPVIENSVLHPYTSMIGNKEHMDVPLIEVPYKQTRLSTSIEQNRPDKSWTKEELTELYRTGKVNQGVKRVSGELNNYFNPEEAPTKVVYMPIGMGNNYYRNY